MGDDDTVDGDHQSVLNHIENGGLGLTVLHIAAANGDDSLVERLLKEGADVNINSPLGWTPLMYAARNGHLPTVKVLMKRGANPLQRNKLGASVMNAAIASGFTAVVDVFLEELQEIEPVTDSESISPILTAVLYGQLEVIKLLLKKTGLQQLKSNFSDNRGVSLLMIAAAKNDVAVRNFLLENGANDGHSSALRSSMNQEGTEREVESTDSGATKQIASDLIEQYGWSLPHTPDRQLTTLHCKTSRGSQTPSFEPQRKEKPGHAVCRVPVPPISPYGGSVCGFSYPQMAPQTRSFKLNRSFDNSSVAKEAGYSERVLEQGGTTPHNLYFQHWWDRKMSLRSPKELGPVLQSSLQKDERRARGIHCADELSSSPAQMSFINLPKPRQHQFPPTSLSLTNLLLNLNLGYCIDLFANQEIDMDTFLTLNHEDLQELGISSPNSRNKLLRIITAFRAKE